MATSPEVIIVGGGVMGTASAYYLARRGVQVLLLERDRIGADASSVAAGILGILPHAAEPGAWLDLGSAGLRAYQGLAGELKATSGIDIEHVAFGTLQAAFSENEALRMQSEMPWQRAAGHQVAWLDAAEARKLEPGLGPDVMGVTFAPEEHHVWTPRVTDAFAQGAARAGATIRLGAEVVGVVGTGRRVEGVRLAGGETVSGGSVLIAAGSWTGRWSEWLGVPLPVTPVRGQMLVLYQAPPSFRYSLIGGGGCLVAKTDGTVMAGVTVEDVGFDKRVTAGGIRIMMERAMALLPDIAGAEFRGALVGFRPQSADGLPLIGRVPTWDGLYVAAGHFRDGMLLGPVTGQLMAELITQGETGYPLTPFDPARFLDAGER